MEDTCLFAVVSVGEDARGGDEAVDGVAHCTHQHTELRWIATDINVYRLRPIGNQGILE